MHANTLAATPSKEDPIMSQRYDLSAALNSLASQEARL
jgi:hypothetical protein